MKKKNTTLFAVVFPFVIYLSVRRHTEHRIKKTQQNNNKYILYILFKKCKLKSIKMKYKKIVNMFVIFGN